MTDPPAPATTTPTASVAVCTLNGGKYLAEQLDSIASQSRAVDEVVISDDGSSDGTVGIIRSFQKTAPFPVHFNINRERLGVTRNFENAISRCGGDLIFLSDQDDRWHGDKVERIVAEFADPDVGLVFSDGDVVDDCGNPLGYGLWDAAWFSESEQSQVSGGDALRVLLRHSVAAGCSLAFRSRYKPLILPLPDLPNSHDIWIALLVASVGRLCPMRSRLLNYRLHGKNTVGLRRHNLLSQIRMARWQFQTGAFDFAAQLHAKAVQRLLVRHALNETDDSIRLLREKARHSLLRDAMKRRSVPPLPNIVREWWGGNYQKYSYGFKSVLQDLFLSHFG